MADISKITLPSGNTYNLKDQGARDAIAALQGGSYFLGVTTTVLTDESTTNPITVDGNSVTATNGNMTIYGKKEFVFSGTKWVEFGDLTTLNSLAYRDSVILGIGNGDIVLGESTTFTNASSSVSFSGGSTDVVLGEDTTFTSSTPTITVTPTTTNIKATASGTAVGANGTDTFVKSYPGASSKLVTTTITGTNGTDSATLVSNKVSKKLTTTSVPNVTSVGSASTWAFNMGTGNDAETLIITGANNTTPTLGTAITCATGDLSDTSATSNVGGTVVSSFSTTSKTLAKVADSATTVATGGLDANGGGSSVMTGLGTATTASALTGVKVTTQPTVKLSTGATAGTGVISVATGITSASSTTPTITVGTNDKVTTITGLGTGTAAAQTITVGTNDKVKVAKYDDFVGDGIIINNNNTTSGSTVKILGTDHVTYSNYNPSGNTITIMSGGSYNNRITTENGYVIDAIYWIQENLSTLPSKESVNTHLIAGYWEDDNDMWGNEWSFTINDAHTEAIINIDSSDLTSANSILIYTASSNS